jgi:dolichyl-phosphate-mannose--protein O-mannosyl transferase
MYAFHSGLAAKHGYTSPWWTWPITLKPVLFYRNIYLPAGSSSVIYSMGNPALWWAGAAATLACIFYTATEGERAALFIAAAVLSQLLPWAVFSRPAFLYFFFPAVPFYALAAVYAAKRLAAAVPAFKNIFIAYQAAAVMLFAAFYPAISGARVPAAWINGLNWISIWKF